MSEPPCGGLSARSADPLPSESGTTVETLPGLPEAQAAKRRKREAEAALLREAVAIWNTTCGDVLPAVAKLNDTRRHKLLKRLREDCNGDLEVWWSYCQRIRRSRFCCGDNDRGWLGNIDWALRPATFSKVMEGVFDNREPKKERRLSPALSAGLKLIAEERAKQGGPTDDEHPALIEAARVRVSR